MQDWYRALDLAQQHKSALSWGREALQRGQGEGGNIADICQIWCHLTLQYGSRLEKTPQTAHKEKAERAICCPLTHKEWTTLLKEAPWKRNILHRKFWDGSHIPRKWEDPMASRTKYLQQIEVGLSHTISEGETVYTTRSEDLSPTYSEIISPEKLSDPAQIAYDLKAIDWAFTTDDTGFLTHDLHPYPAKFIPQIPGHVIARLSLRGELVLDPFGGSGTTALEGIRLGRRALSIDANPVGTLIGKVKTCNIDRSAANDLRAIKSTLMSHLFELPTSESLCREYEASIPDIPNIDKWFPLSSRGELAFIRSRISTMDSAKAIDIALLALSKIVLAVSFQDSETRYSSKPRHIHQGETTKRFLGALDEIVRSITRTQPVLRYGVCEFVTADARQLGNGTCKPDTVDLIVTSPPYGNANDYHLYHRFRLLWLGYNPRHLASVEIGSHLRHQKESSGFDSYLDEMRQSLSGMYRVLKAGRYAVLVVGDAIYSQVLYNGAESLRQVSEQLGFETICVIERNIHSTKRSFVAAGRRATTEKLLVLRKPSRIMSFWFQSPPYKLWPYESILRRREVEALLNVQVLDRQPQHFSLNLDPYAVTKARRLVFTHGIGLSALGMEPTWQAIIENGLARQPSARKDPKYVTHGLHTYKGKFYPQLAKGLMNLCNLKTDASILDPFCGSGTTLLEGYLNGYRTFGCDMHPLAAKIAKAKVGILEVSPNVVHDAVGTLFNRIDQAPDTPPEEKDQLDKHCLEEINRWFPKPVVNKLNWLLRSIRSVSEGVVRDFLEVVLSSIIREVSQQDPTDLRIRKRKVPLQDADVFGLYLDALDVQYQRIERFWSVRGYSPTEFRPCRIVEGDSREKSSFGLLGIGDSSIDLILTSPPYATALPYIDTDRLSLLILFGLESSRRRPVELKLVGSREISPSERNQLEKSLVNGAARLPRSIREYLEDFHHRVSVADVGFRRKNMPSLLLRFLLDMDLILENCRRVLKPSGDAMVVIGDNRTRVNTDYERIPTTDFLELIAVHRGFNVSERIDISVTTENLVHMKNAITENVVLHLKKPAQPTAT
jgi:DNA modification methylase